MTVFLWKSAFENFQLKPNDDGSGWVQHSDIVAHITADGLQKRMVLPAGMIHFKPAPEPRLARAGLARRFIKTLKISPMAKDDLYLAALHADKAPRIGRRRALLRLKGVLRYQWRYAKVPK